MRAIKINRLWYSNFRGQSRELDFKRVNIVSGRNRTGKSTCLNVILMLLTDADDTDRSKFNLFDERQEFSQENAQTCIYGAEIEIDGEKIQLQKSARQKWTREKGKTEWTKSDSDEYRYYLDGVEVSAGKYNGFIEDNFAPMGKLKLMLNLDLWRTLDWKELRKRFSDIVGEITIEDFKGDYSEVLAEIQEKGAAGAKEKYHNLIKSGDARNPGYEKQINDLEASIEANKGIIPDISVVPAAERRIEELNGELKSIDDKMLGYKGANDELLAKRRAEEQAISSLENEMRSERVRHESEVKAKERELRNAVAECESVNRNNKMMRESLKKNIADLDAMIKTQGLLREEKLKELETISNRRFDGNCPFCGTELTGELKTKRIEEFKTKRDSDRAVIISQGKAIKARIEDYTARRVKAEEQLAGIQDVNISDKKKALEAWLTAGHSWENTEECKEMSARLETMRSSLTVIPENPDATDLLTRKGEIMEELKKQYDITSTIKTYNDVNSKIGVLSSRLKSVIEAKAECERKELLCDQYIDEESQIIKYRANKFFPEDVEVVMRKRKKDGELIPCCEMRYRKVNGLSAGTERRMQIGVAIARAFMQFYEVQMPLIIDNTEGIDNGNLPDYDGQIIMAKWADSEFNLEVKE